MKPAVDQSLSMMILGLLMFLADLSWSCSRGAALVRLAATREVAAKSFENEGDIAGRVKRKLRTPSSTYLLQHSYNKKPKVLASAYL
jgi:hypothetical protein